MKKGLWIRVEAHEVNSVPVAQLAEALGIKPVHALGHLTALGGAVAEHTEDGMIADVPNSTMESWAQWDGKRGAFATAVREILQDGNGRLYDWLDRMGKLVERREKDRQRMATIREKKDGSEREQFKNSSRNVREQSENGSQNDREQSTATVRHGTGRKAKTTTRPAARAGDPTFDGVMQLVRERLYVPDGQPPDGWEEKRDGSILKKLHEVHSYADIAVAVAGLALLRDHPGKFADAVDWLTPNAKATLRALYETDSGVLPMFNLATMAYWKHANLVVESAEGGEPR